MRFNKNPPVYTKNFTFSLKQVIPEHIELQIADVQDIRAYIKDAREIGNVGSVGQSFIFGNFKVTKSIEIALIAFGPTYKVEIDKNTKENLNVRDIYILVAEKDSKGKWSRELLYKRPVGIPVGYTPFITWDSKTAVLHYGELLEDLDEGSIKWDKTAKKYKYIPSPSSQSDDD